MTMLTRRRAISLLAGTVLATGALAAHAQSANPRGRTLFEQKACTQCHAFESRNLGPSVKDMKAKLKGSPEKASVAMTSAFGHADELKSTAANDIRALAEWLAGTSVETPVAAPPPTAAESAAAKREAAARAWRDAADKAKAEAAAKAQARRDAAAAAKADAQAKRDAAEIARRQADAKARKDTGALETLRREAEAQAQAKREAEAKARADAVAAQQRETDERARRDAEARAKKDAEGLATQKREAEAQAQAKRDADVAARKEAPTVAKAEPTTSEGRKKIPYRDGSDLPPCAAPTGAPLGAVDEEQAKAIIDRVGCPQCHAYVQKKTGPPMKKIYEKYKNDWECVVFRLKKNKTHGDEGVTQDIKADEFKIVADYIATRGK